VKPKSYSEAGVSIDKGDSFARFIASLNSPAISPGIGGFAGGIELDLKGIESPVMLSSTDGVGTKLLVAQKLKKFDTLGIDLVAMCVNDLIVAGVKPQIFLDYISCGHLDEELLQALMTGIVAGCEQAGCTLAGGETAEMPDLYGSGDFDLAGFCVGVGDKSALLPRHEKSASETNSLPFPPRESIPTACRWPEKYSMKGTMKHGRRFSLPPKFTLTSFRFSWRPGRLRRRRILPAAVSREM
jgi:phosphoribosylformylglycinamidine cyclo-ligase